MSKFFKKCTRPSSCPPSSLPLLRGCLPARNNGQERSIHEERETPLIRRRRRMRFNIGWPGRERSARRRFVVSVGYTYGRSLVSLTNVSAIPRARLLLEGRRHPLTRDSAVSVTREPNLIPSHPCSRRPWRPFNYWRTCFRLVIAYYLKRYACFLFFLGEIKVFTVSWKILESNCLKTVERIFENNFYRDRRWKHSEYRGLEGIKGIKKGL